ncbi:MAG: bi-domain-containing oxidoreductase [Bacteroidota bacterium]
MLQAIAKKGKVIATSVPAPVASKGSVLIKVVYSCISAGTETSSVQSSGLSAIKKAITDPNMMRKAIDFAKSQGISKTIDRIKGTLKDGKPIGYSVAGIVVEAGEGVTGFSPGDRVAAAGAGLANHAEYVNVPVNLVTPIPAELDFAKASTVTLGTIALQGTRRCDLRLGEFCVVIGTGILGLLALQILRASGIRVIAVDIDEKRLGLARELGGEAVFNSSATDPVEGVMSATGGHGADAVLFTAATASNEPLSQAFRMCKKKGRVVLVGVSGMEIKREDMYEKELDFLISTAYGPGRYDRAYEEKGLEYPYGYVRWTEDRNMAEYLRLVAAGQVRLDGLINEIYPIAEVEKAFESLKGPSRPIIALLDYGQPPSPLKSDGMHTITLKPLTHKRSSAIGVGIIGAGNFVTSVHLPNLAKLSDKFALRAIMRRDGQLSVSTAKRFNAAYATTDAAQILNDPTIDLVVIGTRHDSHAELALRALQAGKHVFVEKPLATDTGGLEKIVRFYDEFKGKNAPLLMVGFNRRFSPYAREIKRHTDKRINPLFLHYRMNAGYIPPDHWVHESGGRIIGEACHIIDLMTFFTNSRIESVQTDSVRLPADNQNPSDNKTITLKYADGSLATIEYFASGSKELPKEYLEVHFDQKTIVMEDYRSLKGYGITPDLQSGVMRKSASSKGHFEELESLASALRGETKTWPIELWDLVQTTQASILAS